MQGFEFAEAGLIDECICGYEVDFEVLGEIVDVYGGVRGEPGLVAAACGARSPTPPTSTEARISQTRIRE